MPKYWGKQIFTHGRFPEVGQKQKTEKKILQGLRVARRYAKIWGDKLFRTREIPGSGSKAKDGEKRKKERKLVITMAKLRMAHASTHGARKHAWRTQAAWAKNIYLNVLIIHDSQIVQYLCKCFNYPR